MDWYDEFTFTPNVVGTSTTGTATYSNQSGKYTMVGDLIFFTTTAPGPTHVGISIGGDQFIHAPSSRGVVRIERLSSSYWSQRFLAARRIVGPDAAATPATDAGDTSRN